MKFCFMTSTLEGLGRVGRNYSSTQTCKTVSGRESHVTVTVLLVRVFALLQVMPWCRWLISSTTRPLWCCWVMPGGWQSLLMLLHTATTMMTHLQTQMTHPMARISHPMARTTHLGQKVTQRTGLGRWRVKKGVNMPRRKRRVKMGVKTLSMVSLWVVCPS